MFGKCYKSSNLYSFCTLSGYKFDTRNHFKSYLSYWSSRPGGGKSNTCSTHFQSKLMRNQTTDWFVCSWPTPCTIVTLLYSAPQLPRPEFLTRQSVKWFAKNHYYYIITVIPVITWVPASQICLWCFTLESEMMFGVLIKCQRLHHWCFVLPMTPQSKWLCSPTAHTNIPPFAFWGWRRKLCPLY